MISGIPEPNWIITLSIFISGIVASSIIILYFYIIGKRKSKEEKKWK